MEVASTSLHAGLEDTGCWAPGAGSRESRTRSSAEGAGHDRRSVSATLARWIAEIQRVWAQGGTRTLGLARVVNVARGRLPYGQWTALWTSGQMPFSKRKTEMLVVIGARLGWMDAQTFAHLPRGWSIVYCLARLNRPTLESLIQRGAVHPGLRLSDAKALLAELTGQRGVAGPKRVNVRQRLERLGTFVQSTLSNWTPEERAQALRTLTELLEHIGRRCRNPGDLCSPSTAISLTGKTVGSPREEAPTDGVAGLGRLGDESRAVRERGMPTLDVSVLLSRTSCKPHCPNSRTL